MPAVPPAGIVQTHLYVPYFNQNLWDCCSAYLRTLPRRYRQRRGTPRQPAGAGPVAAAHRAHLAHRPADGAVLRAIAEFIRYTVHESASRAGLLQDPVLSAGAKQAPEAGEFGIEQLLWRSAVDAQDINRRLRAMGILDASTETVQEQAPWTDRRYVESAWNRAKPAANYDVADRLAVYGVAVDFAAASGSAGSELSRALLDEFNISLLPTENPFTILFVRTVHGLALDDLDSMRRYRQEMRYLPAEHRALLCLDVGREETLYQPNGKPAPVARPQSAPAS